MAILGDAVDFDTILNEAEEDDSYLLEYDSDYEGASARSAHLRKDNAPKTVQQLMSADDEFEMRQIEDEQPRMDNYVSISSADQCEVFDTVRTLLEPGATAASNVESEVIMRIGDGPDDWTVKKIALGRGEGGTVPEEAAVLFHYNIYAIDAILQLEVPLRMDSTKQDHKRPFRADLGAGELCPGVYVAICSMRLYERSLFIIKPSVTWGARGCMTRVPPDTTIAMEIRLFKILHPGSPAHLLALSDEKVVGFGWRCVQRQCEKYNNRAIEYYLRKDPQSLHKALRYFWQIGELLYRTSYPDDTSDQRPSPTFAHSKLQNRVKLLVKVHCNAAIVCIAMCKYAFAMENTRLALEQQPKNIKVLLLRVRAALRLENYSAAREALQNAEQYDNERAAETGNKDVSGVYGPYHGAPARRDIASYRTRLANETAKCKASTDFERRLFGKLGKSTRTTTTTVSADPLRSEYLSPDDVAPEEDDDEDDEDFYCRTFFGS